MRGSGEINLRETMIVPEIVQEQWRIQICHIARIACCRRVLIIAQSKGVTTVITAGKSGKSLTWIPDLSRFPPVDPSLPFQQFIMHTRQWYCPLRRSRVIPIRWPDGRLFGAIVLVSPPLRIYPAMDDSYRFLVEETLRLGLQTAKSKVEAGYEKLVDPLHRELFARMVNRSMDDSNIALLSIGADNGRQIREQYGDESEMQAMAVLARRMVSRIRGTDLLCSLEDGRFLALMREADTLQHVAAFTQKLLAAAREDIHFPNQQISLRVSIGVAFNKETVRDYDQLVRQAHAAMYQARRAGGDRFVIFNPGISEPGQ